MYSIWLAEWLTTFTCKIDLITLPVTVKWIVLEMNRYISFNIFVSPFVRARTRCAFERSSNVTMAFWSKLFAWWKHAHTWAPIIIAVQWEISLMENPPAKEMIIVLTGVWIEHPLRVQIFFWTNNQFEKKNHNLVTKDQRNSFSMSQKQLNLNKTIQNHPKINWKNKIPHVQMLQKSKQNMWWKGKIQLSQNQLKRVPIQ